MSFGKLYGFKVSYNLLTAQPVVTSFPRLTWLPQENARTTVLLAVAKANNLDIELVETRTPVQDLEYFKLNPLGRIPTFVGANGYILTETMAIAVYCAPTPSPIRPNEHSKMSHIINTVIPV